jgi:hypothetical protein
VCLFAVSLRYGYGLMDAARMVDLALVWKNVPEKHVCLVAAQDENMYVQEQNENVNKLIIYKIIQRSKCLK